MKREYEVISLPIVCVVAGTAQWLKYKFGGPETWKKIGALWYVS